eukprot:7712108-Prorocentrum_lima.AAC.1
MGMARTMVDETPQKAQSALELEDSKAMICHKYPEGAAQGETYLFKNYNHKPRGNPRTWDTGAPALLGSKSSMSLQ